jgi:hypothetical protein
MTLGDIINFCCETTGDISSEALNYARSAVRLKYSTLYDGHAWREAMRVIDLIPVDPDLNGAIFLPYDAEEVIFLSISYDGTYYSRLTYRERDWLERYGANQVTVPGNSPYYYRAENLAWPYFNPGKFTFTTSDKSPFSLYIEGRDTDNFPISESFSMQGIVNADNTVTPATISTANSYALVTTLSKTVGSASLSIFTDAVPTPIVMSPSQTETLFTQLRLAPPPIFKNADESNRPVWVRTQIKLKADTLDNDMSVPRISHIMDCLIEFTLSALYTKYRQLGKADAREQKAMAHLQAAVHLEKNQSEFAQQVVPIIYDSGDYRSPLAEPVSSYRPFG